MADLRHVRIGEAVRASPEVVLHDFHQEIRGTTGADETRAYRAPQLEAVARPLVLDVGDRRARLDHPISVPRRNRTRQLWPLENSSNPEYHEDCLSDPKPSIRPYIKISLDKIIEQHGDRILANEKAVADRNTKEEEREKQATKNTRWAIVAVSIAVTVAGAGIKAYYDLASVKRELQTVKNIQTMHQDKHITSDKILSIETGIRECSEEADARLKALEKLHPRRRTR